MKCVEYELQVRAHQLTMRKYEELLTEWEAIFSATQPQGIKYDGIKVQATARNLLEEYVERKERLKIDERAKELEELIISRRKLIQTLKEELYESNQTEDIVYRMRIIDQIPVDRIARKVHYSRETVYRILRKIAKIVDTT